MGWFSDIFKGIGDFFDGVIDTIVNIGKSIIGFVGDVFSFVIGPFGGFETPNVNQNAGETARGVTITKNGTTTHIPIVYGYRRVGGSIVFAETNGSNNKYLYVCYVLAQGEIEGVRRLFVDDVEIPTAMMTGRNNTLPAGAEIIPPSGRYKNLVRMQMFNGASGDAQSSLLNGSNSWSNKTRTIPGVAYLAVRYEFPEVKTQEDADNNPFKGGIPAIQAEILGKRVFNVASLNADSAGYDFSTAYASLSKSYSINPVNQLLDYMIDPNFGCGLSATEIDAESFVKAANKCNQYVTYYTGQQGRALTGNQVILTNNKLIDNVKATVQACRGIMPYVQGKYKMQIEDGGNLNDITSSSATIVYSAGDDDIIGGIEMRGEAKNTKYNQVVVNYVDPDTDFQNQSIAFPETDSAAHVAALAADNNEELKGDFNFPSITNVYMAKDLAQMIFDKSRQQRQIQFTGRPELMTVVPGDIVNITNSRLGLSADPFRVIGMNIRADSTVSIEAVEHLPTIYPYITTDEEDTFEFPFLQDPIIPDPIRPITPDNPVGVVPPLDGEPVSPTDPNPPATDSAGFPVAPIQNPVPPPAPDETQMPDPKDVQVGLFQGPRFNSALSYTIKSNDVSQVIYNNSGIALPAGNRQVVTFNNATDKTFFTSEAPTTVVDFRNEMVRFTNGQPFSQFQCIADDTGGGKNPYFTNGEYGGSIIDTTTTYTRNVGDLLDVSNIELQQDSSGEELPLLVTFSSAHGLADFDIVQANDLQMGNWSDTSYKGNPTTYPTDLVTRALMVKVINATQVELYYYGFTDIPDFSKPFGFFGYVENGWVAPTWSSDSAGQAQFQVRTVGPPTAVTITKFTTKPTFEKLKTLPTCSIYNPYEYWTVGQDVSASDSAGGVTVSANLGATPIATFEQPTDPEILKRGPRGLYPRIFCNPPLNVGGIVIYKGTVGGGLKTQGYVFGMKNTKYNPSTFEGDEIFAWPWASGNKEGINPLMLVTSNRDFFKIRFTDAQFNADGSLYWEGANLYSDGSAPTPTTDSTFFDPSVRYDLPGWTYTNEKGESVTGYGIEAYLNYSIQQLSADVFNTDADTTTSHGLGA